MHKLLVGEIKKRLQRYDVFKTQELANTVWALAKVNYGAFENDEQTQEFIDYIGEMSVRRLGQFKLQEICNLLWGIAKSGHCHQRLFRECSSVISTRFKDFVREGLVQVSQTLKHANHLHVNVVDSHPFT